MKKIMLFLLTFMLISSLNAWALGFDASGGFWHQSPSGDFSYKDGTNLSLKDLLNFNSKTKPMVRAKLDLPLINFYAIYTPMKFEGSTTLTKTITFGGVTFNANTKINTSLKMNQIDLGIYWGIPLLKTVTKVATLGFGGLDVNFGLGVKAINFDAKITSSVKSEEASFNVYIPMLYGGINLDVWRFNFDGELRGIAYGGNHYYDFLGLVKFTVFSIPLGPEIYVDAGYRYQDLKLDTHDVKGSVKFDGIFGELGIGWSF